MLCPLFYQFFVLSITVLCHFLHANFNCFTFTLIQCLRIEHWVLKYEINSTQRFYIVNVFRIKTFAQINIFITGVRRIFHKIIEPMLPRIYKYSVIFLIYSELLTKKKCIRTENIFRILKKHLDFHNKLNWPEVQNKPCL